GVGVIRLERKNGFLDQGGLVSGIGYFQPNHFSRRFSEFLEERTSRRLNVDRNQDGTWMITTTTPQEVHSADSYFPIGYDPVRCLVVWAEWVGNENAQSPWAGKPWKRHVVKWKELKEGLWVPSTISQVNVIDRTISRGEFQDVQVNEHLDESTYSFSYPVSTRMTDEVEKTIYVVSTGVIDEQQAVRDFMDCEALRDAAGATGARRWLTYSLVGAAIIAAATILALIWRRRALKKVLGLVLCSVLASHHAAASEPDRNGTWRVSHGQSESIAIAQCGLHVSVFALEYFDISYKIKHVSTGLPPTEEGTRCSDLKAILEAHGLDVASRDSVTFDEMKRALTPGVIAIFPVKVKDAGNHFL